MARVSKKSNSEKRISVYMPLILNICQKCGANSASLYIALYAHKGQKTKSSSITIKALSVETGISIRTINTLVKELYEAGFVIVNTGKKSQPNEYWFPYEDDFDPNDEEMLSATKRLKNISKKK